MASMGKKSSGGWAYLCEDLLGLILDNIGVLPDYIRFGAVCKSWQSIAMAKKGRRMTSIYKEPPMLLIPTPDMSKEHRNLYSIFEQKIYNCRLKVPYSKRCCGSSYGWWAIGEQDLSITLLNPFLGKTIHLPVIAEDYNRDDLGCPLVPEFDLIHKVILSCDPSNPDGYTVAAVYDYNYKAAFIRSGEQSWTCVHKGFTVVNDILFHKRMLYVVNFWNQLMSVDYIHYPSDHTSTGNPGPLNHDDDSDCDGPDVNFLITREPSNYSECSIRSYLVESSGGDLLLVRRLYTNKNFAFPNPTLNFEVYKLKNIAQLSSKSDEEKKELKDEKFKWVEIQRLDNDDALFLGDNLSTCISASPFPNCCSNSIYCTDDCIERDPYSSYDGDDMGVFDLENRKMRKDFRLSRSLRYMSPATWISPTLH